MTTDRWDLWDYIIVSLVKVQIILLYQLDVIYQLATVI